MATVLLSSPLDKAMASLKLFGFPLVLIGEAVFVNFFRVFEEKEHNTYKIKVEKIDEHCQTNRALAHWIR